MHINGMCVKRKFVLYTYFLLYVCLVFFACFLCVLGTTMDYIDSDLASEFTFNNPKETGKCGCGESFTVKETA